jgi:hypothetical protein
VDPRAGQITLTEWVNLWFPALDLELTTLRNYRYLIEVLILPVFADRSLASLRAEEIAAWELRLVERGYSRRTARDARSTLTTVLGDAIPLHLKFNPAQRRRGKGRKGQRRIEWHEKAEKAWATPHLPRHRAAVVPGEPVCRPRPGGRTFSAFSLWRPVLPARCGWLVPGAQ